jgi:hypothetical protein
MINRRNSARENTIKDHSAFNIELYTASSENKSIKVLNNE